jgi:hypothetical protein
VRGLAKMKLLRHRDEAPKLMQIHSNAPRSELYQIFV